MYMHPASFTDELLNVFAEQPDKFPYLDMPLQHIDSQMLADMRRMTDESGLRQLLDRIRVTKAPQLTLADDIHRGTSGRNSGSI